jgi:ATP-dependent helicase/nuclease subunit A
MTRARNELYITGSLDISNNDEYDDFSLLLKNYIITKSEKTEKYIEGDSILNNDTLFGILLPSIVSHIPAEGLKKSPAFFNLEEIPRFSEEYIRKQLRKNLKLSNDQKGLNEFIKKVEPFYTQCETIKTPVLSDNHITPTSFHKREKESAEEASSSTMETISNNFCINKDFSGEKSDDIFNKVDSILARFSRSENESSERFNSGSFGTIAHICVAAYLNKKEPVIPSNISCLLNPAEMTALLEAGKELAERFVSSPLGKITEKAKLRESEFPFRTLMKNKKGEEIFINGTIDLFFDDTNTIHIIDFKTDNREEPSDYIAQMSCYYHAILSLFAIPAKKDCRVWLYYLRTGHAVELTERIKQFNLEQRAFDN